MWQNEDRPVTAWSASGRTAAGRAASCWATRRTANPSSDTSLRQNITAYQGVDLTEECRMTLSEWLDRWLEQMASVLRPSTLKHYRSDMEHHVKLYLGQKKLTQTPLLI